MFTEDVANFLTQHLGTVPYLVLAFGLFLAGPVLLLMALQYLLAHGRHGPLDGLALGFAVASWASLCWLAVPYCGGYPCLPGLVAVSVVSQAPPIDRVQVEVLVHAVNFVLWPVIGLWVFYVKAIVERARPKQIKSK